MPREKITGDPIKKLTCNHEWEYTGNKVNFRQPDVAGYESAVKSEIKFYTCKKCSCKKEIKMTRKSK